MSQDEGRDKGKQQSQTVQLHMPSGQIWQPEKSLLERLSEILTVTTLCTNITTTVLQYQYILISHSPLYNFLWNLIVCHLYSNLRLQIYRMDLSYYTEPQSKITCYMESHRIDITLHRINIRVYRPVESCAV